MLYKSHFVCVLQHFRPPPQHLGILGHWNITQKRQRASVFKKKILCDGNQVQRMSLLLASTFSTAVLQKEAIVFPKRLA